MSRPERSDPGRGGPRSGERPTRIAHYRIVDRIGRGGMGVVYRAIDEKLGRPVALKLLSRRFEASPEMQARFIREARAASALTHPGIVTVHDVDAHEGRLYIVMEWIDGHSLGELARAGLSIAEALRLCAEAADALGAAHETGVLHRDIKCENLMATRDRRRLKVLDFGLAKLRAGTLDEAMRDPVTSRPPGAPDASPAHDEDEDDDLAGSAAPGPTLERPRPPGSEGDDGAGGDDPAPHVAHGPLDSDDSLPPLARTEVGTSLAPLEPTRPAAPRGQRAGRALAVAAPTPAHPASGSASGDDTPGRRSLTSSELTAAGAIMGTPAYMAPEQTVGGAPDVRSEVFSLGVVLYELLVGRRPFAGDTPEATMRAVHEGLAEPPSRAAPARGIPPVVDAVVMTALAHDPADRFPDMPSMARALRAAIDALTPLPGRPLRPYLPVALALALLAALGGALVVVRRADEVRAHAATTRRISFEPGCEEYPSFAPDGRSLVFDGVVDSDYELFSLDLESGARRRLTRASAWDYGGAVSPDGGRVAYVHLGDGGRELRVLPLGPGAPPEAPPLALGPISGFASWASDGTLVSARPDGRIVRLQLEAGAPPRETTAAALPPGNVVRFVSSFADGTLAALWLPSVEATRMALGVIRPGAPPRVLDDQLPYDATSVVVAPGERAFYTARSHGGTNELLRHRRGGGPPTVVPGGVSPSSGFSISSDGRRLAYSTCRESVHLARLRPGSPPQPISGSGPWRDRYPVVAGDHRVLFTSDRSGGWQIWSLDLRTRESVPLGAADTSYAAVSPDGATLGYCDHGGVRVRPLAGGPSRALTDDGHDTLPSFTHDGRALVFERTDEAGSRTFVVPIAGGAPRPLTPPGARFGVASPTEDRVVFLLPEPGGGQMRLMSTTFAGAPPVPLSPSLAAADLSAPAFTADGRSVLVVRRSTEVLEVPIAGGPAVVRFRAGLEGIEAVRPAPDGDGLLAAVILWEGDLWLAEGDFR